MGTGKVTIACVVCGTLVEDWASQKRLTCSRACTARYMHQKRKEAGLGGMRPPTRTLMACVICGKDFWVKPHQIKKGRRFCSPACRAVGDRAPRTLQPCGYCGKEMSLKPSAVANGRTYCSMECRTLGQTKSWTLLERTYNGRPGKQDRKGYIWVWAPERANRAHPSFGGWYPEHRIVVEAALGYDLPAETHVHHVNGRKDDNRLTNLVAMGHTEHLVLSGQERLAAIALALAELAEYRRRYGPLTDWPATAPVAPITSASSASAAAR